jgi:hypothetical protein
VKVVEQPVPTSRLEPEAVVVEKPPVKAAEKAGRRKEWLKPALIVSGLAATVVIVLVIITSLTRPTPTPTPTPTPLSPTPEATQGTGPVLPVTFPDKNLV